MRLSEKYVPTTLDQIVGQPAVVRRLKHLVENPEACCLWLEGKPGVGKTATANALVNDLGTCPWSGRHSIGAARLGVDKIEMYFDDKLRLRPMNGCPWQALIVEEMERCVSAASYSELKNRLSEGELPWNLIVVATSNDSSEIQAKQPALLERFERFAFSSGPDFHDACMIRLEELWGMECEARGLGELPLPGSWTMWGVEESADGQRFSMRRAINAMGNALEVREVSRLRTREAVA